MSNENKQRAPGGGKQKHRIGNPQPVAALEQFLDLFDVSVRDRIQSIIAEPGTLGAACFENLDFCSSVFGTRSALIYGPHRTCKDLDALLDGRLGDVPSRFQYPVKYYVKPVPESVATDKTEYARSQGYTGTSPVLVSDGKVLSHGLADWFEWIAAVRKNREP